MNGHTGKAEITSAENVEIQLGTAPEKDIKSQKKPAEMEKPDKKGEKEKKKEEPAKLVGPIEVFRFSDAWDKLLMIFGSLFALGHGAALPLMIIVFGDMIDLFVGSGKLSYAVDQVLAFLRQLPAGTFSDPIPTREASILEPEVLRDFASNYSNSPNISLFYPELRKATQVDFLDEMEKYAVYYIAIGAGVLLLAYVQVTFWLLAAERQTHRIRKFFCNNIFRQDIGWFDTHASGELSTRLSDDIIKIHNGLGDKMGGLFQWLATCITGFTIGFVYGWKLTLVILAVSPLLGFTGFLMQRVAGSMSSAELAAYAKAGAVADEVLSSIRTVVAFGGQDKECHRYSQNLENAKKIGIKKGLSNGFAIGFIWVIVFGAYALGFWYGGKLVRDEPDTYTIGRVLIVFFCVLMGAFSLGNIGPYVQAFGSARGAAYVVFQLIDQQPAIDISSVEGLKPTSVTGNISFRKIDFTYPARKDVQVLKKFDLEIKAGQTVALVGASGCGKSTVVALLQRFYDPQSGEVLFDGHDIRRINLRWLREHIGIVSQEPVLFATSIRENIWHGCEDVTEEEIKAAAMMANAHDFIMKLPEKYETLVGERGAQLSGGQKQRIAIARALVKDPKILLLDEATSALDTESESVVQEALDKARTGRTTIIVAHRLSTIKNADVIAGFENGVIVEHGTHEELMAIGGVYKQLVQQQTMTADEEEEEFIAEYTGHPVAHPVALKRLTSITSEEEEKVEKDEEDTKSKEEKKKEKDVPFSRIMRLNAPEWPYILCGSFCALINGGVQPSFAVIFAEILGVFAEQDLEKQKKDIALYCLMLVVIGVVSFFSMLGQSFFFGVSGERLTMRIRQLVFKGMMRQEMAWFDDHKNSTGALTTRLAVDASLVQGAAGVTLGTFFQSLANIGTALVIAFIYGWKLTLVVLAFLPIVAVAGALQMKMMAGVAGSNKEALETSGKIATETITNIRTVTSLSIEKKMYAMYVQNLKAPYNSAMRKAHVVGISFSISQGVLFFAYAASFYVGAILIRNDEMDFEDVFKVFSAIVFGAMALGQASAFAPDASKAKVSARHIFRLLDTEPSIDPESTAGTKIDDDKFVGRVSFENAKFFYPSRKDVMVLHGLDLAVEPGKTIALVGASGCGKSTTVQLIERFYDVTEGTVKLDGINIKDLNLQWLRLQIGIVSQEPVLFDCSIAENIAYGDNTRTVEMQEIIAAARNANIHNFVESLPNGYDTNVGSKGTQLSGGQKQRVAIARALLRNPKILLLDEATSALDTESEKIVQEALDRASQGRTCIVIAHRLSTIQNSDKICVIKHGEVAEQGRHSELMKMQGMYYRLNAAQARQK